MPDLNEAQSAAVNHPAKRLLVVAGPGTGKTHTLVYRLSRTINTLTPNAKILSITFTNKAAEQLKERLLARDVGLHHVFVGTFHAFCLHLLREYWDRTALPKDFKIASEADLQEFDRDLLRRISLLKSTCLAVDADDAYKMYQRSLRERGLIDFDDILRETLSLLDEEDVLSKVRNTYQHIFVDEYQDINIIQHALLKVLVGQTGSIFAIGDPDQSIYGFRGSQVALFNRFTDDFSGAATIDLNENYRSAANLLQASHQVIAPQGSGDKKALLARMYAQGHLTIHEAASDRAEADYVASQIEKLIGGTDMRFVGRTAFGFGDIAILFRLNAQRHCIAQALDHLGLPYQVAQRAIPPQEYSDEAALGQQEEALEYNVEKVSLLSLHASKGLEFPIVFIIGCEEHLLPLDIMEMNGDPQEERRLFYVGMTRAKQYLYLTHAKRRQLYGKTYTNAPSPYLGDIQEELKAYAAAKKQKYQQAKTDDGQMSLF